MQKLKEKDSSVFKTIMVRFRQRERAQARLILISRNTKL